MAGDATLKAVQAKINSLGYTPALVVDGIAGQKTTLAILWARQRFGLGSGGLDASLMRALGVVPVAPSGGGALVSIPGLQPSVVAALPALFGKWEGRSVPWMYLDEKGYVTCGTGNLIDPVAKALALGWVRPDGSAASSGDIASCWNAIDALRTAPKGQKQPSGPAARGGFDGAFQKTCTLRLPQVAMERLVLATVAQNQNYFMSTYPGFQSFPADAQMAFHSLGWAWGPGFASVWDRSGKGLGQAFKAAVAAKDFASAASIVKQASAHEESINPGIVPRDVGTEAMLMNASAVLSSGKDVAQLFYPASAGAMMGIGLAQKALAGIPGMSGTIGITDLGFVVGGMIVGGMFLGAPGALIGGLIGAGLDFARRAGIK